MQVSDLPGVWGGQPPALSRRRFHPPKDERRRSESRRKKRGQSGQRALHVTVREDRETRTFRTFRTIRTRLRQAAPWQAARTTRNSARGQGKLYCSRRGVDGFPRTFPCRSTVPPVLRKFRPASFPPLSESSEKSEGSELSSRPLHRPTGSPGLHPPSLHRSTVTLVVPQHFYGVVVSARLRRIR